MTTTTLSYKSVLVLAQSKGYNNVTIAFTRKVWGDNAPGWQEIEKDENLCELTLIQKWLRDEHKIIVVVIPKQIGKYTSCIYSTVNSPEAATISYSTYEKANLEGTYEALKLL